MVCGCAMWRHRPRRRGRLLSCAWIVGIVRAQIVRGWVRSHEARIQLRQAARHVVVTCSGSAQIVEWRQHVSRLLRALL